MCDKYMLMINEILRRDCCSPSFSVPWSFYCCCVPSVLLVVDFGMATIVLSECFVIHPTTPTSAPTKTERLTYTLYKKNPTPLPTTWTTYQHWQWREGITMQRIEAPFLRPRDEKACRDCGVCFSTKVSASKDDAYAPLLATQRVVAASEALAKMQVNSSTLHTA